MMTKPFIHNIATHLITGFLGSGKTSFINACIAHFKHDKKWAILVNEAGQIGIDEKLFAGSDELAIRQVAGGCICCTSQLPLQIALARLTSEHQPDRLWIEPTGLAHPKELIEQLSQPHWQTALSLKSTISIVNARQWQDLRYRNNDGYQAHVRFCDVVVVNRFGELSDEEKTQLANWLTKLNPTANILWQHGQDFDNAIVTRLATLLEQPSQVLANRKDYQQVSLTGFIKPKTIVSLTQADTAENDQTLPFRYHDKQADYQIVGWRLSADWTVDVASLMNWLLIINGWQRIKAVIHTDKGDWQRLNFTPDSLDMLTCEPQVDNRLEVIVLDNAVTLDFEALDSELMTLFQTSA